ncbi:MAG: FAD binding domain-containing protein [Gammaproteobacteria bacterium]|nr:FAD binding domain-containing protein [Gammaproteobacteria bacterium]
MQVEFTLNGQQRSIDTEPRATLLSVLREQLDLRGCKYGCGEGECGACTVLLNGRPITSCMTLAGQVNGLDVVTIEAMPEDAIGKHVVTAFADTGAVQCGFCTPGFILATQYLLSKKSTPSRDDIRAAVAGNLCRCTGYTKIVDAGIAASHRLGSQLPKKEKIISNTTTCSDDNFVRPNSLGEVLQLLRQDTGYKLVCGSTDISVHYEHSLKDNKYIDLSAVADLDFIREENDSIIIGAATTYSDIIESSAVQEWANVLSSASREVGGVQIQNLGTLGGNLANASPSADGVPVLIVLGAAAIIRSATTERSVPVEQIAAGPGKTNLHNDEVITEIVIPKRLVPQGGKEVSFFEKFGPRQSQTIAIVSVSFCGSLVNKQLSDVKIALGAVAPTIVRAPKTEAYLMAEPLNEERILEAASILAEECSPIDDIRGSASYRKRLVSGLLIRGLWPHIIS